MIAGPRRGEQRQRDRGEPRGNGQRCVAALERRDRALQIAHGGQTVQAIGDARIFTALGGLEIGDRVEQDRRRAVDRRVDRAQVLPRIAAEVRDRRGRPQLGPGAGVVTHAGSGCCSARCDRRHLRRDRLSDVDDDRGGGFFERRELAREQRRRHEVPAARGKPRLDRLRVALEIGEADLAALRKALAVGLLERGAGEHDIAARAAVRASARRRCGRATARDRRRSAARRSPSWRRSRADGVRRPRQIASAARSRAHGRRWSCRSRTRP